MVEIIFNIQDLDYPNFKTNFLRENPLPEDSLLTEDEWIGEWGREQYLAAIKRGKRRLAEENVVVNPNIIICSPKN